MNYTSLLVLKQMNTDNSSNAGSMQNVINYNCAVSKRRVEQSKGTHTYDMIIPAGGPTKYRYRYRNFRYG